MLERTFDATRFNEIINDPSVRPYVADEGDGVLDLSLRVAIVDNVCLIGEHGAFLCFRYYPGCYEVHTQVLPSGRGAWAQAFALAGAQYMFTNTDCTELVTRVPERHLGALRLAVFAGFRHCFKTPPECRWCGELMSCFIMSMTLSEWASRPQDSLTQRGREFHEWLNACVPNGTPHVDDDEHNKIVGTCLSMIDGGEPVKAVLWYNRSAYAARHEPIKLLSIDPLKIQFDAGYLTKGADGSLQYQAHP